MNGTPENPPKRMRMEKQQKPCCVPGCKDFLSKTHRFPKNNLPVFRAWIRAVKPKNWDILTLDQVYNRYLVCDVHFAKKDCMPGFQRGLKANAVPMLNLPVSEDKEVGDDLYVHESNSIDYNSSDMDIDITLPDPITMISVVTDQENNHPINAIELFSPICKPSTSQNVSNQAAPCAATQSATPETKPKPQISYKQMLNQLIETPLSPPKSHVIVTSKINGTKKARKLKTGKSY
ncbi:uncharacterized protein LOC126746710 [Anthonomus grandis grandis]|uniref:uncharacterized protein LOC126746710 n=1 Tax=Anthonomus grandis grandis TaxID=2921223 RepID=UPI00216598FB|nr:uncharacterized protein LOC126746710 [Anthonomus grandis grandis]